MRRKVISLVSVVAIVATAAYAAGAASRGGARAGTDTALPGFSQAVFLSHVNDPDVIPGFPGDPTFSMKTSFTVANDGFYLQYVKEGEHTGTHFSSPCHFHADELCADQMDPGDFILPAVVVDIRAQTAADVDYRATVADLEAWVADHGPMPHDAAVLLWTGCDEFWGPDRGPGTVSYYSCGSGKGGFHQPGFSLASVRWLIDQGVLGDPRPPRHGHVRSRPRQRLQVPRDVADAARASVHAREPDEPRGVAGHRRVDHVGRPEERRGIGRSIDRVRPDPVGLSCPVFRPDVAYGHASREGEIHGRRSTDHQA